MKHFNMAVMLPKPLPARSLATGERLAADE
jgi:hypothetical protein